MKEVLPRKALFSTLPKMSLEGGPQSLCYILSFHSHSCIFLTTGLVELEGETCKAGGGIRSLHQDRLDVGNHTVAGCLPNDSRCKLFYGHLLMLLILNCKISKA